MTRFQPKFPTRKNKKPSSLSLKRAPGFCSWGWHLRWHQRLAGALWVGELRVSSPSPFCLKMQSCWWIDTWTLFFPAGIHFNLAPDSYFIHSPKPQNQDRFTACTIWARHGGAEAVGTEQVVSLVCFLVVKNKSLFYFSWWGSTCFLSFPLSRLISSYGLDFAAVSSCFVTAQKINGFIL